MVAVITALPSAIALTNPSSTVATLGAEEDHDTFLLPASSGVTVAVSDVLSPAFSVRLSADSVMPVTAAGGSGIEFVPL